MKIHVGCDLELECAEATPLLLLVHLHASRAGDLRGQELLRHSPASSSEVLVDAQGNRCCRLIAPAGLSRIHFEACVHDSGMADPVTPEARQVSPAALPVDLYAALNPSRYCDSDRLGPLAWSLFAGSEPGWGRVQAICDWVHEHIRFDYASACDSMTAHDTLQRGSGVCRDFAHLVISFCRCLNIPARYCTGYLGYTGIPEGEAPVDFSAWLEVWLDGGWHVFDARHNVPRVGRVLIARGRDASDVPFLRSFGAHRLVSLRVITEAVPEPPPRPRPATPFPHPGHAPAPDLPAGPGAP